MHILGFKNMIGGMEFYHSNNYDYACLNYLSENQITKTHPFPRDRWQEGSNTRELPSTHVTVRHVQSRYRKTIKRTLHGHGRSIHQNKEKIPRMTDTCHWPPSVLAFEFWQEPSTHMVPDTSLYLYHVHVGPNTCN